MKTTTIAFINQPKHKETIALEKKIDSIIAGAEPHSNSISKKVLYHNFYNAKLFYVILVEENN